MQNADGCRVGGRLGRTPLGPVTNTAESARLDRVHVDAADCRAERASVIVIVTGLLLAQTLRHWATLTFDLAFR